MLIEPDSVAWVTMTLSIYRKLKKLIDEPYHLVSFLRSNLYFRQPMSRTNRKFSYPELKFSKNNALIAVFAVSIT